VDQCPGREAEGPLADQPHLVDPLGRAEGEELEAQVLGRAQQRLVELVRARQILGHAVVNEHGEAIGRVQDIIVSPDGSVSHAIIVAAA
jgi:hypothetical protein